MHMSSTAQLGFSYPSLGVDTPFDGDHTLVTSPLFSATALVFLRLSFALYTTFTLIFILVWEIVRNEQAASYLSYFTHLSYIGLCAYFWAAGVQTFIFALRGNRYPLQSWPRPLQFLHVSLYSSITTFPFVVTVVFWTLLASSETFSSAYLRWSNVSVHALNALFALFEIGATNVRPAPWRHLPFLLLCMVGYLAVAYITHATQGFYTYAFLDPKKEKGMLAVYIAGIPLAECVLFAIVRAACDLRGRFFSRNAGFDGDEMGEPLGDVGREKEVGNV